MGDSAFENPNLTRHYVEDTLTDAWNGIRLGMLGEDGDHFIALGHVTDQEVSQAVLELVRGEFDPCVGPEEISGGVTRGWAVFTGHREACTGKMYDPAEKDSLQLTDEELAETCNCDEYQWYLGEILSDVAEANAKRTNAVPITEWVA